MKGTARLTWGYKAQALALIAVWGQLQADLSSTCRERRDNSPIAAAFSFHGFHTVTLGKESRVMQNFGPPSSFTVRGTAEPSS